jgi:hypothetical protein
MSEIGGSRERRITLGRKLRISCPYLSRLASPAAFHGPIPVRTLALWAHARLLFATWESSLPLRSIDVDFAIDSSGFATSRFVRWFDHEYGQLSQEYDWVKVSLMCGVKTNVVTAVEIDERYAGDSPGFVPLLKATAQNFTIREVSADAIYSSYENLNEVAKVGGVPFVAFKANATPQPRAGSSRRCSTCTTSTGMSS